MMYKNRSSAGRRLRSLALVPACAAALLVACTPAAKSVIEDASEATLDVSDSKDSENYLSEVAVVRSSKGNLPNLNEDSPGDERTVYINDELKDMKTLNELSLSEIVEMTADAIHNAIYVYTRECKIEKSKRLSAMITKDSTPFEAGEIDLDGMKVYIDGKLKDADALKKLDSSEIKSIDVVHPKKSIYVTTNVAEKVVDNVEEMPEFPGGIEALMKHLAINIRYPENAAKANIQGRVVVKFIVGEDGKVLNPEIVKGVSEDIDAEALRVVNTLPSFIPGKSDGKPVAVSYHLPINFKLQS